MRICLIGESSGHLDEGMRNVAYYLSKQLSVDHQILLLDPRRILSTSFWKDIRDFHPQIIHYIPGPSIISFITVKAVSLYCRDAKMVMSAMHHGFYGYRGFRYGPTYGLSSMLKPLVRLLKPDLLLTQSYETENMFTQLGCKTMFLPCGVDTKRFIPVPENTKRELRHKYGLDEDEFIALHIGSVKNRRNIQMLHNLCHNGILILIIARTSTNIERKAEQKLQENGCIIRNEYYENIEEIYCLSDCYVFPTVNIVGAIEVPLSVLEAMSCNIPVISTRFGALPRLFQDDEGLLFADNEEEFVQGLKKIKNGLEAQTRRKVLPYSWEKITARVEKIYEEILSS